MIKLLSLTIFIVTSFFFESSHAFLENTTHGYSNCMTCHYSPAGGNMLNDYGRTLSTELMSTWAVPEGVEQSFGGLFKESKWARVGGDFRTLQRYLDTPDLEDRSLFIMQNNVELGLRHKKLMLIGTLGSQEGPRNIDNHREFISERHYLLVDLSETSKLRVGKFRINYGINDPNHNRFIKRNLGFGFNSERYNIEYSKFFENYEFFANYSFGRIDLNRTANDERSVSLRFTHYLNGKSRLTLNYLYGESPSSTRSLLGAAGVSALSEKAYIVYELDYENKNSIGAPVSGGFGPPSSSSDRLLTHTRVGYELFKGFKTYGIYDFIHDLDDTGAFTSAPGLGFQWLPVTHFELQLEYQNIRIKNQPDDQHFGFIMAHVYY